jgi:predicted nuclease of predicted toxin-antitoxin system
MKFLADENISTKVVNDLKSKGIDVISLKELGHGLSDEAVLEAANAQGRIVLTFDDDFGELIYGENSGLKV